MSATFFLSGRSDAKEKILQPSLLSAPSFEFAAFTFFLFSVIDNYMGNDYNYS